VRKPARASTKSPLADARKPMKRNDFRPSK
jgi:hypothetical protein